MEALATGIRRIDDECKEAGVKYEFVKEKYGFTVKFYRHCGDGWGQADSQVVSEKQPNKQPNILPGLVRVNNIREFHFSRNPMIVELLNEYDLVKEFGEGVDRVYRDMAAAGLPEPEYRQSEFMLYAMLKNKNWGKEDASWVVTTHDQALSGSGPEKGPEKGPETEMDELSMRCNAVLAEMKANPQISRPMLMKKLNLTEKQVRIAVDQIKAAGKAHYEGPRRGGFWIVNEDNH